MGNESDRSADEVIAELETLQDLGWTMDELATVAGVTKQSLFTYKRDRRLPPNRAQAIHAFYVQNTSGKLCEYNKGVNGSSHTCESCGWNPKIAKERENKWREQTSTRLKLLRSGERQSVIYQASSRTISVLMTSKL